MQGAFADDPQHEIFDVVTFLGDKRLLAKADVLVRDAHQRAAGPKGLQCARRSSPRSEVANARNSILFRPIDALALNRDLTSEQSSIAQTQGFLSCRVLELQGEALLGLDAPAPTATATVFTWPSPLE
jgi:hypothetical protein